MTVKQNDMQHYETKCCVMNCFAECHNSEFIGQYEMTVDEMTVKQNDLLYYRTKCCVMNCFTECHQSKCIGSYEMTVDEMNLNKMTFCSIKQNAV